MKKTALFILVALFIQMSIQSQTISRREINIPNINGFQTLKCDFHIHTVFSNGLVWPTVRIQEAWMEGLDVIAFTDHLEYHTFDKDVVYDDNRATEIAKPAADLYNIVLIKGTEITRKQPLGHFNAIFTTDNNAIRVPDSIKSIAIANQQNAFVFWNHPGEDSGKWTDVQEKLYKTGQFKGIEVANHNNYFSIAQQWCMDKNLTMIGTSDIHNPITFDYNFAMGEHRTMTLVFAKERSAEGIKDALLNQRTAVYWKNKLIGKNEFLKPIFDQSISNQNLPFKFKKSQRNKSFLFIKNSSSVPFSIVVKNKPKELSFPSKIKLAANSTTAVALEYNSQETGVKKIILPVEVDNLYILPNTPLSSEISFELTIE